MPNANVVRAAGVVLLREGEGGREFLLVHRQTEGQRSEPGEVRAVVVTERLERAGNHVGGVLHVHGGQYERGKRPPADSLLQCR